MGIMDQASRLTEVMTDRGHEGRISLEQASARVLGPENGKGPPRFAIEGLDRNGDRFEAKVPVVGVSMDRMAEMAVEINVNRTAELGGRLFDGMRSPRFSIGSVRSGDVVMATPRPRTEHFAHDAGRLAARSREVLREEMLGQRRIGAFDRGLVTLAAEVGEGIAEMGRRGEIHAAKAKAVPLTKGPGSVDGIPLAVQMRMGGGRGLGR